MVRPPQVVTRSTAREEGESQDKRWMRRGVSPEGNSGGDGINVVSSFVWVRASCRVWRDEMKGVVVTGDGL